MYSVCKAHYLFRLTVTAHETYTSDITPIAFQKAIQHIVIKRITNVILKSGTVATWAAIRTLGEVKR
jgi:hypothetical protein